MAGQLSPLPGTMRWLLRSADIQTCEVKPRRPEPLQVQQWQIPVFTLKVGVEDIPREKEISYREGSVIARQTLTPTSFPAMVRPMLWQRRDFGNLRRGRRS